MSYHHTKCPHLSNKTKRFPHRHNHQKTSFKTLQVPAENDPCMPNNYVISSYYFHLSDKTRRFPIIVIIIKRPNLKPCRCLQRMTHVCPTVPHPVRVLEENICKISAQFLTETKMSKVLTKYTKQANFFRINSQSLMLKGDAKATLQDSRLSNNIGDCILGNAPLKRPPHFVRLLNDNIFILLSYHLLIIVLSI